MKLLYVGIAILGGLMIGTQAPINGALGKRVGGIEGALFSFLVGTLVLLIMVLTVGKGNFGEAFHLSKWQWLGGILGAVFVTTTITAVPRIGAAATIASAILGQMIASILIDHFGAFGVSRIPLSTSRLLGVAFVMGGVFLIFKQNF